METWVSAAITAGATIIGALISGVIGYFVAISKAKQIIERLPDEHKELHGKCKELQGNISSSKKELSIEHKELASNLFINKELLAKIIANQEKEEAIKQAMPKEAELLGLVKGIYNSNASLNTNVVQLQNEKVALENAISSLRAKEMELTKELATYKEKVNNLEREIRNLKNPKRDYDEYEL